MNPTTKVVRGLREVVLPLALLLGFSTTIHFVRLAWTVTTHAATGQNTAAVAIEKDHHYIRVFALTLSPGAQSFVQHEHNYLTIQFEEHEVIMWKDGESPIQHFRLPAGEIHFFLGGSALGRRNDANTGYRNVTVEFLDPQVTTYGFRYESGQYDYGPNIVSPPVDPLGHFANMLNLESGGQRCPVAPRRRSPSSQWPSIISRGNATAILSIYRPHNCNQAWGFPVAQSRSRSPAQCQQTAHEAGSHRVHAY